MMPPRPKRAAVESPRASEPLLSSSAMHASYGGLLRSFFARIFGPIDYPRASAERIHALAADGSVIYVARARSTLMALYFNYALSRLGLPLARFVGGINLWLWQPVDRLWKLLMQRSREVSGGWRARYGDEAPRRSEALLADIALRGDAAFLFLQDQNGGAETASNDYLRALVAAQHVSDTPIYLVPHTMADRAMSGPVRASLRERLFGARRRPGRSRQMRMGLLRPRRSAMVRVGDAVDLRELLQKFPDDDDTMLARRLRHELDRRISEEERVIAGPELATLEGTAKHVVRDPRLRAVIDEEVERSGKNAEVIARKARSYLREIAARYNPVVTGTFGAVMRWIFTKIYDGIVVDEVGLARAVEASRKGPIVFCPAHRSHVDYLILSLTMWDHGVAPPHIAAGANLSFFPIGQVFRASGAFFLRRTFKDNPLYAATFRAYVRELVRQGVSIEFFMEGGRSRTGKHLMPRLGFLGMVVDAWRMGARDDVVFVPVSIDYERIIEAGSYERELLGGEKKREDISGLLKTTKVLRSRYGRMHVQFGEPISMAEHAADRGLPQSAETEHEEPWRLETERLGHRIMHEVAMVSTVTPTAITATALLAHAGRGLPRSTLLQRAHEMVEYLDAARGRLSEALYDAGSRDAAILEAVARFVDEGLVAVDRPGRSDAEPIYRVPDDKRVAMDYYKNALMNYFAPTAVICRCLLKHGNQRVDYENLMVDAQFLSRLFKREFLYQVGSSFETVFDEALAALAVRGLLDVHEDGVVETRETEAVAQLAGLLDSFVEGYWVVARTATELRSFPLWKKELGLRAMERARRAFLEGEIRRPEAAGKTLVDTAITWSVEAGILEIETAGKRKTLKLAPEWEGEALDALVDDIGAFL